MADIKRVFLIVLDSLGIGAAPDAEAFGDVPDCNTFRRIACDPAFRADTVRHLGMGEIEGVEWLGKGAVCKTPFFKMETLLCAHSVTTPSRCRIASAAPARSASVA
jgi:hypothetical protein